MIIARWQKCILAAAGHFCILHYGTFIEYKFLYICQTFGRLSNSIFGMYLFLAITSNTLLYLLMWWDPGFTEKNSACPEDVPFSKVHGDKIKFCEKCMCLKTARIHHCSTCQRCIWRMDHHCIWIAQCVGHCNQKHFIIYLALSYLCAFLDAIVITCAVLFGGSNCQDKLPLNGFGTTILVVITSYIMSLMCIAFLGNLFLMQIYCAVYNTTYVEIVKGRPVSNKTEKLENLKLTFGSAPSVWWCIPCTCPQKAPSSRPADLFEIPPDSK